MSGLTISCNSIAFKERLDTANIQQYSLPTKRFVKYIASNLQSPA